MNYFIEPFKKYASTDGRARRKEYWSFTLFNLCVFFVLFILEYALGIDNDGEGGTLSLVYRLGILIPSIGVGIRRMHDVNKSGWFLLVPIYSFILTLTDGTVGDNKYGPDPKTEEKNIREVTTVKETTNKSSPKQQNISMFCRHCGKKVSTDSKFCPSCGKETLN